MRFLVALIGSLVVFAGVFFLTQQFINPHLPSAMRVWVQFGSHGTTNLVGLLLSLVLAGAWIKVSLSRRRRA